MAAELSEKRANSWIRQAVFALDRWLCRRHGTYEFSNRAGCLFRIERCTAERPIRLSDGTCARAGDPVLRLHLWNENMPRMERRGPTVGWASQASRALDTSLGELAHYLSRRADLAEVRVLFGDMCLATSRQTEQFKRIMGRYGFEAAPCDRERFAGLRRVRDTIYVFLLVLATNPIALRRGLRHYRSRIFLSRAALEQRYSGARRSRTFSPADYPCCRGGCSG